MEVNQVQYPVALVKVFQGIVDCVEIHPNLDSAWESLRQFINAPEDATWDQWEEIRGEMVDFDDIPAWYDDDYIDSRVLDAGPSAASMMPLPHVITFD